MANKYIDTSATYNGDGTASNQAASAGAVGAWNSFLNPLTGVPGFGSLAAGDVVYVRTKNGASNLSEAMGANKTASTTPTAAAPITWVFDPGVVWTGDAGTFTVSVGNTSTTYTLTLKDYHNFLGNNNNFVIESLMQSTSATALLVPLNNIFRDCVPLKIYQTTSAIQPKTLNGCKAIFYNCTFYLGHCSSGRNTIICGVAGGNLTFINCVFDMTGCITSNASIFNPYTGDIYVIGGKIIPPQTDNSANYLIGGNDQIKYRFHSDGLEIGNISSVYPNNLSGRLIGIEVQADVGITNIPGTNNGFTLIKSAQVDWRGSQNYPTLNSILDDGSGLHWSIKATILNSCPALPFRFPLIDKFYNGSAATKTITVEMLAPTTYTGLTAADFYLDISYIDNATSLPVGATSYLKDGTSLATSTAGWSTLGYGAANFSRYKIAITTPSSIKPNTTINVNFVMSKAYVTATTDFIFVDPDPQIT